MKPIRLTKIDPDQRQARTYEMHIAQTLFGEWCVIRQWGRIGARGGQIMTTYTASREEAEAACEQLKQQKIKRGYR